MGGEGSREGWRFATAILLGLSCGGPEFGPDVPLESFAATEVPLSGSRGIVLVDEKTVCTVDSYEYSVYCADVNGDAVAHFGGRGEGPGELGRAYPDLVRGPNGTIGVIDSGLRRMSVFGMAGSLLSEVRLPEEPAFAPVVPWFAETLVGVTTVIDRATGGVELLNRHVEVDVGSREIVWARFYPDQFTANARCEEDEGFTDGLGRGTFSPTGVVVFTPCRGQLVFYAARDDPSGTVVSAPRYVLEYPSEREVREYVEASGPFAMESIWRRTPKSYARDQAFDDCGRLWLVTNRDRDGSTSYLDVFAGMEYWGAVRVRHDALAIDLVGSTLAVLVDRPVGPRDADGYPDRGVDWYDIRGLEGCPG